MKAPTLNKIAIILPKNPVGHRDIVLHTRSDQLQRISEFHKAYDSLQYPILFPHGSDSWNQYVLKYAHKGADQATFQLQQVDSTDGISHFQNVRYIGSTETAWRIF